MEGITMNLKKFLWLNTIPIYFITCRSTRPEIKLGGYSFEFQGKNYNIEGVTPDNVEGYNIITRREGDTLVFRAIDKEQDGTIDELSVGNMTMDQVQLIYQTGIDEGEKKGFIKKRALSREYRTSIGGDRFILTTHILALGDTYNKLSYYEIMQGREVEMIDLEADGIVDRINKGNKDLGYYQKIYRNIIDRGLKYGNLQQINGKYIVVK